MVRESACLNVGFVRMWARRCGLPTLALFTAIPKQKPLTQVSSRGCQTVTGSAKAVVVIVRICTSGKAVHLRQLLGTGGFFAASARA
jgi:hypothetical protein